jgi:PAS domain S-box-containing protein
MNSIASESEQTLALRLELDRTRGELERCRYRAAQVQSVFLHLGDTLFAASPDGTIVDIGPALAEFLGLSSDEAPDLVWRRAIHPDDTQRYSQEWSAINSSGTGGEIAARLRNHEGVYRPCLMWIVPVFDSESNIVNWFGTTTVSSDTTRGRPTLATRMLGIVIDITDRKKAEEIRKKAEETARATKVSLEFALEAGRIGNWDLDLIHDTSRRSLRHDRCFGYETPIPDAEWGVERFLRHVHPEDRALVKNSFQVAVDALMAWEQEFRVVWPDGSVHWLTARGSFYRTLEGRATRMLGVVMDITDRKATEQALRASEELSRGQVEALKSTLDASAVETTPDRLIGHILRTIAERFDAHSISVWGRDDLTATIGLEFAFEDGRLVTKTDPRFDGMDLILPMRDNWPWPEVFRTGKPSIIEDIRTVPSFTLRDRLLPLGIVTVLLVPMSVCGRLEGAIGLRFTEKRAFGDEEVELAQAFANQAMLMIKFSMLSAQSREAAVSAERNRIARDVHDTLAQGLTGVIVQLEAAGDATSKGLTSEAGDHLARAADLARNSLNEARRSVMALRPQALQDRDLPTAMSEMVDAMTARTSLRAQFKVAGDVATLPHEWEDNLLRIGQEAVTNIVRHAHASEFAMYLVFAAETITLRVRDDGRGFIPTARYDGFGLVGIEERVESMGGQLSIESAFDEGATLTIVLPLPGIDRESVR